MADGFVPPQEVRSNAKRGLELRQKHGRGGTAIGVARARDLSNGAAVSFDTIKRMNSYFARHEVDKKGEGWGKDSAGYIAWLLWGGDAGWAWAKKIIREQESKEKSMGLDLTTSYFSIEKADRNADGTLTVYGKATDDSLDIDQQICDAGWLDRAMPEWFKSGGNIREQHSNIAAGVAKEYEPKADGHYISALVVDPVSVKKVETGVLKGFSIGIKRPRVVRDTKAVNGRIVDGEIVEVSLVDRPANPNAKLMLAKSIEGESSLVQVEEYIGDEITDVDLRKELQTALQLFASKSEETSMGKTVKLPVAVVSDILKFDKAQYEAARDALANLIAIEAEESKEGHNEIQSIAHLLEAVSHLHAWYEGEEAEGEVMEDEEDELESEPIADKSAKDADAEATAKKKKKDADAEAEASAKKKKESDADAEADAEADADAEAESDAPVKKKKKTAKDADAEAAAKEKDAEADAEADAKKCPTCGMKKKLCKCDLGMKDEKSDAATDMTPTAQTGATLTGTTIVPPDASPKSVSADPTADLEAIVEEVVEKATTTLKAKITDLMSAREAAEKRVVDLEAELATAKSLAVAGGPKRTAAPLNVATSDLLTKAAIYKAKAQATTDPQLAKGFRALADEYAAKAADTSSN